MAEAPSSTPPAAIPAGRASRRRLLVLVIVAVIVVAALGSIAFVLFTAPTPITLDRVEFPGAATTLDQQGVQIVTAMAIDTIGIDQTANASFVWTVLPAGALDIQTPGSDELVVITGLAAGAATLTATATWGPTTRAGDLSLTVRALHFEVTAQDPVPLVNQPTSLTVRAARADGTTADGYGGTVNFTIADYSAATLPGNAAFTPFDFGSKVFSVTLRRSGSVAVTIRDTLVTSISGSATLVGNQKPTANFVATENGANPLQVTFDAASSSDPENDALTYAWTFGDASTGSGVTAVHSYGSPGSYRVNLTVQDVYGESSVKSATHRARAAPTASFAVTGMIIAVTVALTVNGSASSDLDGTIALYNLTWGDGTSSEGPSPEATHVYGPAYSGQQVTIILRVVDNETFEGALSRPVTLQHVAPTAAFAITRVDDVNRTIYVDASASNDLNANLVYYNWSWGDGPWLNTTSPLANHRYGADNTYTVNLTVVDSTNLVDWDQKSQSVVQPDLPPFAVFTFQRSRMHVDVDASASSDPNGDIATYAWNWGDGTSASPVASPLASQDYTVAGLYTITLTVEDQQPSTASGTTTRRVSVGPSSLDFSFWDFFAVPYGEWWDYRSAIYGDLPINAECFSATAISNGICTADNTDSIPDTSSYPYANWYPLPGQIQPGNPFNNPIIYAPYRFRAVGVGLAGYNRSEPVFLPVLNYAEAPGNRLDFSWSLHYLTTVEVNALRAGGCPISARQMDGFMNRNQMTLTMDLQQSRRLFGVQGADAAAAQAWWNANANAACGVTGAVELGVENWYTDLGLGKYDVVNSFEYPYTPFFTQIGATVNPADGTTVVTMDFVHWGTEVLTARMFYWGNASYEANHLDSTKARGWWGMELSWFEDFLFEGSLGGTGVDFQLTSVMQYHFQHSSLPGPDGFYNRVDDVSYWTWGPILTDYTNDYTPTHLLSELDRYPNATYVHTTPGSRQYNLSLPYDVVPLTWNLPEGHTWHFEFPTTPVTFYDPNRTPIGTDPTTGGFVAVTDRLRYYATNPAAYGDWSGTGMTWDVYGRATTGGPEGTPGPDGLVGTADDRYALEPWGSILLVPSQASLAPPAPAPSTSNSSPDASEAAVALTSWSPAAVIGVPRAPSRTRPSD